MVDLLLEQIVVRNNQIKALVFQIEQQLVNQFPWNQVVLRHFLPSESQEFATLLLYNQMLVVCAQLMSADK